MTPAFEAPTYQEITSDQALRRAAEGWQSVSWVALDTEFVRERTFYPIPGLLQLATEEGFYLIDPLKIEDTSPLIKLFKNNKIIKILHANSEDIELFNSYLGVVPQPLFDTQIAAAFLGYGMSLGYKNLVQQLFDVELPKEEQRSNWLQRPLSKKQREYAISDVVFLGRIYEMQTKALQQKGCLSWVIEECERVVSQQLQQTDVNEAYLKIKGAWQLDGHALAVLQVLAAWRETQARQRDVPRGFLLRDPQLLQLAQLKPVSVNELKPIEGIHPKVIRKDGETILSLIDGVDSATQLDVMPNERLPKSAKSMVNDIKKLIAERTGTFDIAPELIINRKGINAIVMSLLERGDASLPGDFSQWKRELLGDELSALLLQLKAVL